MDLESDEKEFICHFIFSSSLCLNTRIYYCAMICIENMTVVRYSLEISPAMVTSETRSRKGRSQDTSRHVKDVAITCQSPCTKMTMTRHLLTTNHQHLFLVVDNDGNHCRAPNVSSERYSEFSSTNTTTVHRNHRCGLV